MEIQRLKKWFLKNKRELPWRQNPTPYQVWVSEVMLQQTQVSVVIDYYERWMELFPNIETLAKAPLESVIKTWEGLGYYSRARRLHEAARELIEKDKRELPSDEKSLRKIKGLGPYTSSAILSFAYHQKKAAVDGNVIRVITRHEAIGKDVSKITVVEELTEIVQKLLPEQEPWIVMEALIELGALICKKKPVCGLCPLRLSCSSYESKTQDLYPVKKKGEKITKLYRLVLVIESEGCILLHKETQKSKLMADLWEFPYFEEEKPVEKSHFPEHFLNFFSSMPRLKRELSCEKQSFTRYQAYLYPSLWETEERPNIPGYHWVKKSELNIYPFSSGHRKILGSL
jgi:A/G-specific adenine glycosylase